MFRLDAEEPVRAAGEFVVKIIVTAVCVLFPRSAGRHRPVCRLMETLRVATRAHLQASSR